MYKRQADTVRMLFHVQLEQKVEREQVAKVTGTNKDDTAAHEPKTVSYTHLQDTCDNHIPESV